MAVKYIIFVVFIIPMVFADDASVPFPTAENNCTKPGYMCGDCNTSYICIDKGNGQYLQNFVESCVGDHTCSEEIGLCTNEPNPKCSVSNYVHTCIQTGVYPDAFSCTKYYICVEVEGKGFLEFLEECENGFAYDPLTTLCSKSMKNCKSVVRPCNGSESGYIEENPSLFYYCSPDENNDYMPHIVKCPDNLVYNGVTCVDPTPDSGLSNGYCIGAGVFYDPNDCRGYVNCGNAGMQPVYLKCAVGYVFSHIAKTCILEKCPNM